MASRISSVYTASRGLSRLLHHNSTWVFSCQQNPLKLFKFTSPFSINAPHQNVDRTSKDAGKDVSWNLWVPNQFSGGTYEALENYGIDLTELASRGMIDPVKGREDDIERCIHILSQKTKNNPVIVGAAGAGKTAIAEGLAQRISRGDVPECLKNRQFFSIDIGSLLIGAMYTGQFEERIKHIIREVTASNGQIILFIDEIQTVVGAVKDVIRTRRQRSCIICLDLVNFNHIMRPKSYDICSTLLCLRSNFIWQILTLLCSKQQD
ncbi:chaperone protein ClpB3, mitochondrial isoform X1 [Daucus carota subsp. sativus]|uniref:chaperone protein ClpB3, mitochondrial isoform X1 n=1 Tax=Daucus carota subsp. sativus TaxID=79200 RepID=UPI0007F01948|nr:PREDICTED: chaperone protein ClpB3, mitochondrial-like isoform X1 [Daucus carota subsp. sativus]